MLDALVQLSRVRTPQRPIFHSSSRFASSKARTVKLENELNRSAEQGDVKAAEAIFGQLTSLVPRHSLSRTVWNTMLKACANSGDDVRARSLFNQMTLSVKPNARTFGKLIEAAAKAGKHDAAQQWSQELESHGFKLNLVTYSAMIDAAAQEGDTVAAEYWRVRMVNSRVEPNLLTYGSLLNAAAKTGDEVMADRWSSLMVCQGLQPDIVVHCSMIRISVSRLDAVTAEKRFHEMIQANIEPNAYAFNMMLNVFAKIGDMSSAEVWFRRMKAHSLLPDIRSYGAMIDGFARAGNSKEAWTNSQNWFHNMEIANIDGTVVQYSQLMNAFANAQPPRKDDAKALLQRMVRKTVKPNQVTLNTFARAVGKLNASRLCEEAGLDFGIIMSDKSLDPKKQKRLLTLDPSGEALRAHNRRTQK